jgi:hypothetical protein
MTETRRVIDGRNGSSILDILIGQIHLKDDGTPAC